MQGVLDETIKGLHEQDLIEPSESPWCSPVMIVKQKLRDGKFKYRFISDNRGLNEVTIKDSFVVSKDGIKPDHDKVKVINEMEFPKIAKGMIKFLGRLISIEILLKDLAT